MKKIISLILVIVMFLFLNITSFAVSQEEAAAKDLGKYEIMGGFPDGTLRLQNDVTRAQAAKMVVSALGRQYIYDDPFFYENFGSPFRDVDKNHWAYSCIVDAAQSFLINGFADATFRPDDNITCEQVLKIVICALEYDHYDNQVAEPQNYVKYPDDYIDMARRLKLTDGIKFNVGQTATRGFIATILSRALDVPLVESYSIDESAEPSLLGKKYGYKIMDGTNGNELKTLRRKLEGIVK